MPGFLSPVFGAGAQLLDNQGRVLSGGKIFTYVGGTTTPTATFTDNTDLITNPNPIILDSAGRVPTEIWLEEGQTTKFVLKDSVDNVLGTWDQIAGVNDITVFTTTSEWSNVAATPSFISSTSFSLPGNLTSTFTTNRRLMMSVTAGTIYGYVVSSAFTSVTTVVVQPDSTVIDSGISQVMVGLLQATNPSVPQQYLACNAPVTVASSGTTPIGAALSANIIISGTATITAFDTVVAGIIRLVKFSGAATLTHNGTSLILPGAANITTAAGDQAIFRSLGSGNWECISYQVVALAPGTASVATNANTATALQTARNIDGVSFNGTADIHLPVLQNSQSANYTTVASDENKQIFHPAADNNPRTFTIAANASVPYEIGSTLTFINEINTLTIAINSDTLVWAPLGSTGSRTLSVNGIATAIKITSTKWFISGSGLT